MTPTCVPPHSSRLSGMLTKNIDCDAASVVFWRKMAINSAQVRVLYHDSTMRIFESPLTSQDKWEESGLVVVQVRESAVINS